ncbi:25S rRNA (adenine645-N1)-methyltransferase Ecym_5531 [Eremothecium cymbalariae DBVPG|uniref:Ribosomal RNA-processing protein 8 n=1 Tax=Eremothecium cymbalariae (strain CBS 270.75 / DBVPG 7215 / KCTC 17166 / NRRL Y-17582) TaxID=931890 RepID=I6NDX9_ERECY|nr:hypothetical protein Ecym_5531 [Eremothecium cymbalariae DBVPG\
MGLFQVEGWNLDSKKVLFDDAGKRTKSKKTKEHKSKSRKADINVEQLSSKPAESAQREVQVDRKRKHKDDEGRPVKRTSNQENAGPPKKKALTALQQKMLAKLTGSRFRWINEQLYTISSDDAVKLIQEQPQLFDEYHDGFRSQVQTWPENPVNVFMQQISQRAIKPVNAPGGLPGLKDKKVVIADMGCGEAQLSLEVSRFFQQGKKTFRKIAVQVHSFDLKKVNNRITVADIRNVPLPDNSCSIVIFCLSLMGTNFLDFIKEAYRLLTPRGELWIAEIKSRFSDNTGDEFVNALKLNGFFHKKTDAENKMFTRFEFFKPPKEIIEERKAKLERKQKFVEVETEKEELNNKRAKLPEGKWLLKPCLYKRR